MYFSFNYYTNTKLHNYILVKLQQALSFILISQNLFIGISHVDSNGVDSISIICIYMTNQNGRGNMKQTSD